MLRVRSLEHVFNVGTVSEISVLRSIDLDLEDGEFVTVVGSNGAGKSTLFNAIAGALTPTAGSVTLDGSEITGWPEHKRSRLIGRVFQDPNHGTAPSLTIAENAALAMNRGRRSRLRKAIGPVKRRQIEALLEPIGLGLERRLDERVSLLSGGQRQAMTLVMAAIVRPRLLLLDEHTAALDPETARRVLELTDAVVREHGLTTLMITHNMNQAIEFGTRTVMLHKGRILLDLSSERRRGLTADDLVQQFSRAGAAELLSGGLEPPDTDQPGKPSQE
ncbi:MAG: ATP-binding cassette domain-containing protein [bacterium]|nr:ATP-binding cassette domain-containing protein [bacterium]MCY3953263.1 ATP-binding cassette domain-containing protein [bacterium]